MPDCASPFLALRNLGAWPNYLVHDHGYAFLQCFKGTKVEEATPLFQNQFVDPFPRMLGNAEESEIYSTIWPDLETYVQESFTRRYVLRFHQRPAEQLDRVEAEMA